jgi:hypothetical protein
MPPAVAVPPAVPFPPAAALPPPVALPPEPPAPPVPGWQNPPWQSSFESQRSQVLPLLPQESAVLPMRHTPSALQQPAQVSVEQLDFDPPQDTSASRARRERARICRT